MLKNLRLLQIAALFLLVVVIIGFSNAHSSALVRAQNAGVTPTLYCLAAGCPNVTPSVAASITTNVTTVASATATLTPPSPTLGVSSVVSPSQPCNGSSLSTLHAPAQTDGNGGHKGWEGGHKGGFLKDIFRFLMVLIDLLLKLIGSGGLSRPCTPATTTTPAPSTPPVIPSSGIVSPPSIPAPTTATIAPTNPSATSSSTTTPKTGIGSGTSIFTSGPFGNACNPGQLYCNGHVITGGTNNTLYNCEPHSAPSVQKVCPGACKVNSSGNDSC